MLQSMGSQEVRHALVTEQQQLCFQTKSNNGNLWLWVKKKLASMASKFLNQLQLLTR